MERKKIGIMGGTFNPIHYGHLMLAENAYEQFELDQVLIMPAKNPYYKKISSNITEQNRVEMIRLAIQDNPHFCFSDIELKREGNTYTVDTLTELAKEHPDVDYYFILGADSLYHIESWKDTEKIFSLAKIVAASRADTYSAIDSQIEYLNDKYGAEVLRLNSPNLEISSSYLRRQLKAGKSCRYLLPDSVLSYMKEHKLYEERED
ncbi:MAG: nicotinate-nucleotide adenylyltransferase [Lachnospiraceae bacterium]|nr:nicotinate-nucleotide adenylyltransferase [Lachnospiraceae bacterium]